MIYLYIYTHIYLISYHGINISHVKRIKKVGWIIYPTTNPISCLVEHRISDMITYLISSPTKYGI